MVQVEIKYWRGHMIFVVRLPSLVTAFVAYHEFYVIVLSQRIITKDNYKHY